METFLFLVYPPCACCFLISRNICSLVSYDCHSIAYILWPCRQGLATTLYNKIPDSSKIIAYINWVFKNLKDMDGYSKNECYIHITELTRYWIILQKFYLALNLNRRDWRKKNIFVNFHFFVLQLRATKTPVGGPVICNWHLLCNQ